jgi:hypothetical protein
MSSLCFPCQVSGFRCQVPPSILDIDSPILKLALVPAQAPALATATPPPSAPHLHTLHTLTACPLLLASLNSAVDTTPCIALQPVAREVQRLGPPKRVGLGLPYDCPFRHVRTGAAGDAYGCKGGRCAVWRDGAARRGGAGRCGGGGWWLGVRVSRCDDWRDAYRRQPIRLHRRCPSCLPDTQRWMDPATFGPSWLPL